MIIPPGYAHVQHFFGGNSAPNGAAVTYGIAGFGVSTPEEAAALLHDAFADRWMPELSNGIRLEETRVKFGPNDVGPFGTFQEIRAGVNAVPSVSPNVAILVEKRTAMGGRRGRGRFYIPGTVEGAVLDNGDINLASLNQMNAAAANFLTDVETIVTGMVILHSNVSDPTPVTSLTVDPVAATQRRRLR